MQKQTPDLIWGPTYRIAALGSYPSTVKYNFIIFVISTLYMYCVVCNLYTLNKILPGCFFLILDGFYVKFICLYIVCDKRYVGS